MPTINDAASAFLANRRVAVTGVSREAKGHGSNVVYQRLRERGYEVSPSTRTQTRWKAIAATTTFARSPAASRRS
jgi:predicted CoA-binding protein